MKTKKLVLAIAIFGGVLFTAQAADLINLNEQFTTKIDKKDIKLQFMTVMIELEDFLFMAFQTLN